jgi:hypothetical protein
VETFRVFVRTEETGSVRRGLAEDLSSIGAAMLQIATTTRSHKP